ncbi:energy transducer TonB [Hymenobacter glacialis]|uniref:energy transducer TonB n=1 Tax=Hymenobacter glacialis TaxID=1908236 RepID=UPI000F7A34E3|nr:energy transducer TonB [Hymenobacter glacialis]
MQSKLEKGTTGPDGNRVGKWNFYNRKEELELTVDYDSSRVSFMQEDTTRYLVQVGEEWQPKRLARAPRPMGSADHRLATLQGALRYPVSALMGQQQGTMLLSYIVDPNGHTRDYVVEKSVSTACNNEVWRALQTLPDNWIPAIYQGRPVAARFYLTVKFQIMSSAEWRRFKEEYEGRGQSPASAAKVAAAPSPHYVQEVVITAVAQ